MINRTGSFASPNNISFAPLTMASTLPLGVDLWLLGLSEFKNKLHLDFSALVTAEELARADKYKKSPTDFLATRALLRAVLVRYTAINSHELLFSKGEHGKPFLSNPTINIHFNLSHCGGLAVLAVSACGEVGVDIETLNERNYLNIAKRFFHAEEFQALQDCAIEQRGILFYKLWTLKEAFFKATGGGISSGLDKVCFQLDDQSIKASFDSSLQAKAANWQFHLEFITANTLLALVSTSSQPITRNWFDGNALLSSV